MITPKVIRDTSKYLIYVVNLKSRKDKSRRSYVSFSDVCSKKEFTKACFSNFFISLSRVDNLRIEVKDMKKTCW